MSKRGNSFSNSFAALSLHEEQEPKKVLQLHSSRNQKKLEYRARKALYDDSDQQQTKQQRPQQRQTGPKTTHSGSRPASMSVRDEMARLSSGPESPGFLAALEAIKAAEQSEAQGIWPPPQGCSLAGAASFSTSPSTTSDLSTWSGLPAALDSCDPPPSPLPQQPLSSSPAISAALLEQLEQQTASPDGSGLAWDHTITSVQAYSWRCFAMSFAEAARAAGDEDAAADALLFGASEPLSTAVSLAVEGEAAVQLEGVAAEAAAAGLSFSEVLQAQQAELLLQIKQSGRKGRGWKPLVVDWGTASNSSGSNSSCASPVRPSPRQRLPDVHNTAAFPQLEASVSPAGSSGWQQAGRSPHALPRGWKGGRMAPKTHGIKLLRTSSDSSQGPAKLRPSALDLHWDLRMKGLAPLQRTDADGLSVCSTDPSMYGEQVPAQDAYSSGAAVERTRQLLAEQEASAGAGLRGGSTRDRLAQDTLRSMMEKAGNKAARSPAVGGSSPPGGVLEQVDRGGGDVGDSGVVGSKASFSYSWSNLFKSALMAGWEPVGKADGGGGSHFKLRRVLPLSGVVQTMVLPCTPSDSQRGVRNVAAAFKKREEDRVVLESQAATQKQAAARKAGKRGKQSVCASVAGSS